jgi:predicted HTH domain antitoxin
MGQNYYGGRKMNDVVAIRMNTEFLDKLDQLGKEESSDRSSVMRKLILKGYNEMLKEKSAHQYREGTISFSEAAHRAGLTLWDMGQFLVDKGFKSEYSIDDLKKEMEQLNH